MTPPTLGGKTQRNAFLPCASNLLECEFWHLFPYHRVCIRVSVRIKSRNMGYTTEVQIPAMWWLAGYFALHICKRRIKWINMCGARFMGPAQSHRPFSPSLERPRAWGLCPLHPKLEILNDFTLEFVFCKWNLTGQWSMCWGLGAEAHTRSCLPMCPRMDLLPPAPRPLFP